MGVGGVGGGGHVDIAGMPRETVYEIFKQSDVQSIKGMAKVNPDMANEAANMLTSEDLAGIISRSLDPDQSGALSSLVGSRLMGEDGKPTDAGREVMHHLKSQGEGKALSRVVQIMAREKMPTGAGWTDRRAAAIELANSLGVAILFEEQDKEVTHLFGAAPGGQFESFGERMEDMVDIDVDAQDAFRTQHPGAAEVNLRSEP